MKRILLLLFIVLTFNSFGQQKTISVDSIKKILNGSWSGIKVSCKKIPSEVSTYEFTFSNNKFNMTEFQERAEVSKMIGIFKLDSTNNYEYIMRVNLDKESTKPEYNSLILSIRVFDIDKVYISLYEVFYYKDEQKSIHYPGDFKLYKNTSD